MASANTIFLVGFMGCGKSEIGKDLAKLLHFNFLDLDESVEKKEGMSVTEIFETKGETAFREIESNCLRKVKLENNVVSTGGGTPCFKNNMIWMNENGVTVYLKTEEKLLFDRLKNDTQSRPLLKNLSGISLMKFIQIKLGEREKFYLQSQLTFHPQNERLKQLILRISQLK